MPLEVIARAFDPFFITKPLGGERGSAFPWSTASCASQADRSVSNVGLPGGMNGREVADAAREFRPQLKVLFITGFAKNAAIANGHLPAGMALMTKPFVLTALGQKYAT